MSSDSMSKRSISTADRAGKSLWIVSIALACFALALTVYSMHAQLAGSSLWDALVAPEPGNLPQWIVHLGTLPRIAMTLVCVASLALAVATVWAPAWAASQREAIALAGSGIAMLTVFALAWRQRLASLAMILAGMIVSLYCASLSLALAISHFQLFTG